jgi:hypothetical protein
MATTYEKIATTTLGTASSTINFTSIPATYTDLRLVILPISPLGSQNIRLQVNSDTATNYSYTKLFGTGSGGGSSQRLTSQTNVNLIVNDGFDVVTKPCFYTVDFFSYAGSTFKTFLTTSNEEKNSGNANSSVGRSVALYRSTSAMTSINLFCDSTFDVGTTATLYGILKA